MRILLIEDHPDASYATARLLLLSGHDVRLAASGMDAIRMAEEFKPEVALLDIRLPGMDGYEMAKRLREISLPTPLRIVTLSRSKIEAEREKEVGIDCQVTKPAPLAEILRAMNH